MEFKVINICDVVVQVQMNHPVGKLISDELVGEHVEGKIIPDVLILFDDNIQRNYHATIFSAKGKMNFNEDTFFVDYLPQISYSISNLFNSETTIIKIDTSKKSFKKRLKSIIENKHITNKNVILSYSLFWYVMHLELLKKKKAFIHAGILTANLNGLVLTGTGGCGKTSSLFKLLENDNYKYLSEDFGVISNTGFAYYNPKAVSIYASDMAYGKSILSDHKNNFSLRKKLEWFLKRKLLKLNPMIKVKPDYLLNGRIERKTSINTLLYLIRCNEQEFSILDSSNEILLERILDASMRELKTLNELLLLMRANAPIEFGIQTMEEIREATRSIYIDALAKSKNVIIKIPHRATPAELINFLIKEKLVS